MEEKKLFHYKKSYPELGSDVFVASGAKLIGDVKIDIGSSVWYNCVIRGDIHYIKIGKDTNIQDGSVLHVTYDKHPLNIGDYVTVGHNVTLHGCTINNSCLIGMGSVLLDGCTIEENAVVAAGSVVKQGFVVPSGKLVAGVPAKVIRDLSKDEIDGIRASALHYVENAVISQKSINDSSEG